ncbi:MAG: hypothetical protein AAFX52_07995 [Pseudomonadota bacterium]
MSSKRTLFLSAAACAVAFTGLSIAPHKDEGVAFISPVLMAQNLCGQENQSLGRRAFFIAAAAAYAQSDMMADGSKLTAPTLDLLSYPSGSNVEGVQDAFDRGLAYMFNFNHFAGIKEFKAAQELDPNCSLCFWAEGFALGSNINDGFAEDRRQPAFDAAAKALALAAEGSKEEALATALVARYARAANGSISEDGAAFAAAMDDAARAYPDDDFISVVAAEANMDIQPWTYWDANGRLPIGRTARTLELIETVLERNPTYVPAIHLYIHITESSSDPYRAEPFADELAALTPDLGHLVHMPSHTYYRLGRWKKSLDHNIVAVAIDEAYIDAADSPHPMYSHGYYPHNVHFAMTSAQMAGDGATALAMSSKLDDALPYDMVAAVPFVQAIKAAPYFAAAQFGTPEDVLAMDDPGAAYPYLQLAWHYARGEAFARADRLDDAAEEAAAVDALAGTPGLEALEGMGMPVTAVLDIARLTVRARIMAAEDDLKGAIQAMEAAVTAQSSMAYMEPPWWYYPASQTLGGFLLQDGQFERAEEVFQRTLLDSPNNAYALYGLQQAYRGMGDPGSARYAGRLFSQAWLGPRLERPEVTAL